MKSLHEYAETFWNKVEPIPECGCMVWMGATSSHGYGSINLHGKRLRAHRVSWMLAHGPIVPNQAVLHRCDTPLCVNPRHLFLGTQKDNIQDMVVKRRNRFVAGEKNGRAKLNVRDILIIRASQAPIDIIAGQYDISCRHVRAIKSKTTWKHL